MAAFTVGCAKRFLLIVIAVSFPVVVPCLISVIASRVCKKPGKCWIGSPSRTTVPTEAQIADQKTRKRQKAQTPNAKTVLYQDSNIAEKDSISHFASSWSTNVDPKSDDSEDSYSFIDSKADDGDDYKHHYLQQLLPTGLSECD